MTNCETVERPVPPPDPTPAPDPTPTPAPGPDPTPAPAVTPAPLAPATTLALDSPAGATPVARAPLAMMSHFPTVRIRGLVDARGTRIQLLSVRTPAGATAAVRCTGRGCPRLARSSRSIAIFARAARTISFARLRGRLLPGAVIEVRVTRPDRIGKYTRLRIRAGKAPARSDRCLRPGRAAPVACTG